MNIIKQKVLENNKRTLTYLYLQKLKCPKCNRILGGKATIAPKEQNKIIIFLLNSYNI